MIGNEIRQQVKAIIRGFADSGWEFHAALETIKRCADEIVSLKDFCDAQGNDLLSDKIPADYWE